MTTKEIIQANKLACQIDWDAELVPLANRLRQTENAETYRALFQIAAHSQNLGPAYCAALLLHQANPPCPMSCREAIQEMLVDWDISIEEVPYYLAEQFGVAAVRDTVAEIRKTIIDKNQATRLDTIEYWLGYHERMQSSLT